MKLFLLSFLVPVFSFANTSQLQFDSEGDIASILSAKTKLLSKISALSAAKGKQVKVNQILVDFEEIVVGEFIDCDVTVTAVTSATISGTQVIYDVKDSVEDMCDTVSDSYLNKNFDN